MISLERYKENVLRRQYGKTIKEAHVLGICIDCGRPAFQNCCSKASGNME